MDSLGKLYANRFLFRRKISAGSFGVVNLVFDRATNQECALKIEKEETSETQTLQREIELLQQLGDIQGIPKLIWYGNEGSMQMLAMELLGKDLAHYKKIYKKFSYKCCLQLAYDCVEILKNIHKRFIIHRDLKPENIMMSKELDQIYIVDFGIGKIYFGAEHIPFRDDREFIGTTRYASIAAHKGHELSRKDDLESLFYVIIFFLRGNLPWQNMPVEDCERNRLVGEMKQTISLTELIGPKCPELIMALQYIKKLEFQDNPNYDYIQDLIVQAADNCNQKLDGYYDWNEGVKFNVEKKELLSPKQKITSTSKISNQMIWSVNSMQKLYITRPQSQKNLLVPPDFKRGEIRHLSSASNNSIVMGSYSSMRLKYLPSNMGEKKAPALKRMVSIEFAAHDESVFSETMDENFDDDPLHERFEKKINLIINFREVNKFKYK